MFAYYKENFEVYDEGRNLNIQNWHTSYEDFEQNPYWITNRILSKENRMHVIVSLSANLKINGGSSLQARGNVDYINDKVRQQFYASTTPALAGSQWALYRDGLSGNPILRRRHTDDEKAVGCILSQREARCQYQ